MLPYAIVEVRDARNKVLYKRSGSGTGRVIAEKDVAEMNDLMHAVIAWGTGHGAEIGRPAAGKTGTSQDFRDAWFVGYTPDLVTGVWVGNDDNSPMKNVTGGSLPAQIWHGFMSEALKGVPPRDLPGVAGNAASDTAPCVLRSRSAEARRRLAAHPSRRPLRGLLRVKTGVAVTDIPHAEERRAAPRLEARTLPACNLRTVRPGNPAPPGGSRW